MVKRLFELLQVLDSDPGLINICHLLSFNFDPWAGVIFATADVPKEDRSNSDQDDICNCIIHVCTGDRTIVREDEDDTGEQSPKTRLDIHQFRQQSPHRPRSWLESIKDQLASDRYTVRPIKSNRADIEYSENSSVRSQSDEVDGDNPKNTDPHGI